MQPSFPLFGCLSYGPQNGFSSPHSVAIDRWDRLWVADRGNNRTVAYDAQTLDLLFQ